jgi:hypothetical protein
MSTRSGSSPLPLPDIRLTPEAWAAYQGLYNKMPAGIDNTMELLTVEALNQSHSQVDQTLRCVGNRASLPAWSSMIQVSGRPQCGCLRSAGCSSRLPSFATRLAEGQVRWGS